MRRFAIILLLLGLSNFCYAQLHEFSSQNDKDTKQLKFPLDSIEEILDSFQITYAYEAYLEMALTTLNWLKVNQPHDVRTIAKFHRNIGKIYSKEGDYHSGIEHLLKAVVIYNELGEIYREKLAHCYKEIALSNHRLAEDNIAYYYVDKAIDIYQEHGHYSDIAACLQIKAALKLSARNYKEALQLQERALQLKILNEPIDSFSISLLLSDIGVSYLGMGKYEKAIQFFERSLKIKKLLLIHTHPQVSSSYYFLAETYYWQGDMEKAEEINKLALDACNYKENDSLQFITNHLLLPYIIDQRSNIYISIYERDSSEQMLFRIQKTHSKAVDLIEYQLEDLGVLNWNIMAVRVHDIYENAILYNHELYNKYRDPKFLEAALIQMEEVKSYIKYDLFRKPDFVMHGKLPDSIREAYRDLTIELKRIDKRIQDSQTDNQGQDLSVLIKARLEVLNKLTKVRGKIEGNKLKKPSYTEIQDSFIVEDQLIIEYFLGNKHVFGIGIAKDTLLFFKSNHTNLIDHIQGFLKGITHHDPHNKKTFQDFVHHGKYLYNQLLSPIENILDKYDNVTIIPDQELGYIPFEALFIPPDTLPKGFASLDYLIRDFTVSYHYSLSLLTHESSVPYEPEHLFAGYAPSFNKVSDSLKSFLLNQGLDTPQSRSLLGPLQYNVSEVKRVINILNTGEIITGEKATEKHFVDNSHKYSILHLATHGKMNDKFEEYSFIAFHEIEDTIENEWLYHRELYDLQIPAEMVVLSACETGIGKMKNGQGIISIARGFIHAGAESIITTLWNVDDKSSSILMENFYKNLKMGFKKDEALRDVKLSHLQSKEYHHPYYWAAYIGIGNMEEIEMGKTNYVWLIALIGGSVIIGLILLMFKYLPKYKTVLKRYT